MPDSCKQMDNDMHIHHRGQQTVFERLLLIQYSSAPSPDHIWLYHIEEQVQRFCCSTVCKCWNLSQVAAC